jgi:hypothetical protein
MSQFSSNISTDTIEVVTDEMISDFITYQNDPIFVHQALFGYSIIDKEQALSKLNKVYRDINSRKDPQILYEEYLDRLDFESSILDFDYKPLSFEEFISDILDGNEDQIDDEILMARSKLDEIINSTNSIAIVSSIKQQLKYTYVDDNNFDKIVHLMHNYMNTIMSISIDEVRNKLNLTPKINKVLKDINFILRDQLPALKEGRLCKVWYIDAYHNGFPYGSIEVFYNKGVSAKYVMIQNITKYPIPTLIQMNFPEYNKYMPRLNSVLMEPISTVARDLGADYIYVHPLEEQAVQLEKHYGFRRTDSLWELPCSSISRTLGRKAYCKEVEK